MERHQINETNKIIEASDKCLHNPGFNLFHAFLCPYFHSKTIGKSFRLNWPIEINKYIVCMVFTGETVYNDVRQIEKSKAGIKAQAVFYSLVSQQQKLRKAEKSKGQTSTDASFNGPQGRMAALKFHTITLH